MIGRRRGAIWSTVSLITAATAFAAIPTLASPSAPASTPAAPQVLSGTVPKLVALSRDLGPASPTLTLHMVGALRLPDVARFLAYADDVSTPGSPDYHQYLTPAQFGARFGATPSTLGAALGSLRALGFQVSTPTVNHLLVNFTGTVGQVQRAFRVGIDNFRSPSGRVFYANVRNLTVPTALARSVDSIFGLDNSTGPQPQDITSPLLGRFLPYVRPHAATGQSGGATPCSQASSVGYTAPDLATAYNVNQLYAAGLHGEGMTAALVEFDDFHMSNVTTFEQCYGFTRNPVQRRLVDGGVGGPGRINEGEDTLDIDIMLEMLPQLAHLRVYVAPNTDTSELDLYNAFAVDNAAPVISSSWGNCEALDPAGYARALGYVDAEAAIQGQEIFQASGDSGPVDCRLLVPEPPETSTINTMVEASPPYVTAVGGTNLGPSAAQGGPHTETTWNDEFGAGGGGVSHFWTMPSWQRAAGVVESGLSTGVPCHAPSGQLCREVPDVSANADILGAPRPAGNPPNPNNPVGSPGYSYYCGTADCQLAPNEGWQPNGGTSAATPMTASMAVLWNQLARQHGIARLGLLNPSFYTIAANSSAYARDFFDITSDSNSDQYDTSECPAPCNPNHVYPAGPGYDLATGLGTINAGNLAPDLIAQAGKLYLQPQTVRVYGYLHGPATSVPVVVSTGIRQGYHIGSDARWLQVGTSSAPGRLRYRANPSGLRAGSYVGHITIGGSGGTAQLTVLYSVSRPAKLAVSPTTLHFAEDAVDTSGNQVAQSCNSLWNDAYKYQNPNDSDTTKPDPRSLQSLTIGNVGPAGSVLHWSVLLYTDNIGWFNLNPLLENSGTGMLSATEGSLGAGGRYTLRLASLASGNTIQNGYPAFPPGMYHGAVFVTDLANPAVRLRVPVTLALGNGKGTPTIHPGASALKVSLPPGRTHTIGLSVSDASRACGFPFSADVYGGGWATINHSGDGVYDGVVGSPHNPSTSSDPTKVTIPIVINTSGLRAGHTYRVKVQISSEIAEPQPVFVPITLYVT